MRLILLRLSLSEFVITEPGDRTEPAYEHSNCPGFWDALNTLNHAGGSWNGAYDDCPADNE